LSIGDGAENFVAVTGITGTLLAFDNVAAQKSTGSATPTVTLNGVVGQLSGNVALVNVSNVSFGAAMALTFNTTGDTVDAVVTPPGQSATQIVWDAATRFSIAATHVALTVVGQTITGDLTLTIGTDSVQASFANVSVSLGGGILSVTNGQGTLTVTSGAAGGITGNVSGTVALTTTGASFSGNVAVQIDTTNHQTTLVITSSSATLTVAGQTIGGTFTIAQTTAGGQTVVSVEVSDLILALGPSGAPIVTSAGVAGQFSGSATSSDPIFTHLPGDLAITPGAFSIAFNTQSVAVDQT